MDRRGPTAFLGTYKWYYFQSRNCVFDAAFVRQLNATAWVPDANGDLQCPEFVAFDTLGWKPNPFLLSKIRFKPPIIDQLAKEAGIEPGVLDLLKKLGVTSEAELRARLGLPTAAGDGSGNEVEGALKKLLGDVPAPTPPVPDPAGAEPLGSGSGRGGSGTGTGAGSRSSEDAGERGDGRGGGRPEGAGPLRKPHTGTGGRPFISYVAAHPDEEDRDPDGLDQPARMALEAQAIESHSGPRAQVAAHARPQSGIRLVRAPAKDNPARWCEVKAMTGSLARPPGGPLAHPVRVCSASTATRIGCMSSSAPARRMPVSFASRTRQAKHTRSLSTAAGWSSRSLMPNKKTKWADKHRENRHHQDRAGLARKYMPR